MNKVLVYIDQNIEQLEDYDYLIKRYDQIENTEYQIVFLVYYCMTKNRIMMTRKRVMEYFAIFKTIRNKKIKHMNNKNYFTTVINSISPGLDVSPDQDTLVFLCSALAHTINPNLPIWESNLLNYFGLINYTKSHYKSNDYIDIYSKFKQKCKSEILGHGNNGDWFGNWKNKLNTLDKKYKYSKNIDINSFTDIKKLDLFFWKEKYVKQKLENYNQNRNFEKYIACLFSENYKNDEGYKNDIDYIMQRALVGKSLKLLRDGLIRYMEDKMGQEQLEQLIDTIHEPEDREKNSSSIIYDCDLAIALKIMNNKKYINLIDNNIKTKIRNLIIYRNYWAHFNPALRENVHKILDNSIELLWFVNAKEEVKEIERMKKYLGQHDLIPR